MRSALAGLVGIGTALVVACGLDVVGAPNATSTDGGPSTTKDQGSGPALEDSGGPPVSLLDAGVTPDEEPPIPDAGMVDAGPCGPATFSESFVPTDFLTVPNRWTTYGGVQRRVVGSRAHAELIGANESSTAAGLFWLPKTKAKAFKVSFVYRADPPSGTDYIGDGITFTWLTSMNGALGANAVTGQGLGLQPGVTGYAFALDAWRNGSINDQYAPSFNILRIDGTKAPGGYDWHVAKSPQFDNSVFYQWHTVTITVADNKVSATIGSQQVLFSNVAIDTSANIVALGFTASTGGAYPIGFYVDTVQIDLTNATCN
jgi:hypothetical protein